MKKRLNKLTVIGVLIFGLIGAGLLLYMGSDGSLWSTGRYIVSHHWTPGTEQSYQLSITSEVQLTLPGSPSAQQLTQRVSGTLNLRVFDQEEDANVRVGFQLSPATCTLNGQVDEGLQQGLETPFVALFDLRGRPHSFQFPENIEKLERTILEEVIRTFQMVFPAEAKSSWTVDEQHATGEYLAHYQVQKDGSIQKKKTLYTQLNLPSDGNDQTIEGKARLGLSSAVIRISTDTAWIHDAKIIEKIVISDGTGLSSTTKMKGELEILPVSMYQLEVPLFAAANWPALLQVDSRYAVESEWSVDEAGSTTGISAEIVEKRLAGLVADLNTGGDEGRIKRLKRIEQALEANPDLAYSLIEHIQQPGITSATDAWLIHLLERAGTVQSQDALIMVLEAPIFSDWNRIRAIVALGGVANPTDAVIATLSNISQDRRDVKASDMANTALLAVGSIGKTLMEADPERAYQVSAGLTVNLNNARDASEAGIALKAMETMGDPVLGSVIMPYLQDDSPYVRGAAAKAFGRVQGESSIEILTDRLTSEQNQQVRSAIIVGMGGAGKATVRSLNAVQGMVLKEPEVGTRFQMTKYLGDNLGDYPQGKETLQKLALRDKSNRVRKHAAIALYKSEKN